MNAELLLKTKFSIPPTRPGFVRRPRLTARINEGVKGPLTLVSAPAGFGKTQLLAEWAAESTCPIAWLTLSPDDNDPIRFFRYLSSAFQEVEPRLSEAILDYLQTAAEVITMAAHTGTHIDALCHIGEMQDADGNPSADGDVRLFSGDERTVRAANNVGLHGQKHLSIADMPPILVRAVLVDVARYKQLDVLPNGYVIPAHEIQEALAAQNTNVQPGSAVLIRTGFYQDLASGNPAYRDDIAGIGLEAAQWLYRQGMILAGADTMSVEAVPPLDHAVHRYLLVHHGITHLENLFLEELAAQQIYEFLLVVTPLRLQGATGSWVHPIAIA